MLALDAIRHNIAEHPWRAGLYAFAAVTTLALALFVVDYVLRPESFPVKSVSFAGEFRHVDQQALASAVVDGVRGNFFLLDLEAVRTRALTVPWVYEVSVRRRWPDGVDVQFSEQQLAARWGTSGWVNVQGEFVDLRGQPGPEDLPQFMGPPGMQSRLLEHYRRLDEILAPAGLRVARLTLSARHSWNIVLDNGLTLTLGREEPEDKVARFARAWPLALAAQSGRVRRVDLRYANGFAVEWGGRASAPRSTEVLVTGLREG